MAAAKSKLRHPGFVLAERISKHEGLTVYRVSKDCGISITHGAKICRGGASITVPISLRLGRYFGDPPDFWARLQLEYDIAETERQRGRQSRLKWCRLEDDMSTVDLTASFQPTTAPVIFRGAPSQVVNLMSVIKGALSAAAVVYVAGALGLPAWFAAVPVAAIAVWIAVGILQVAFTQITIDTERVTARQGILSRHVLSIELFRIQDVEAVQPWWQRPFGIGTVVLHSSDETFPRWRLFGLRNVDALRDALNRSAITLRERMGIREINMGRV